MSHDLYVSHEKMGHILNQNYTYNYQPVFEHCGMRSLENLNGLRGDIALGILFRLEVGIAALDDDEFNKIVRAGGEWGNQAHLNKAINELIAVLLKDPTNLRIEVH